MRVIDSTLCHFDEGPLPVAKQSKSRCHACRKTATRHSRSGQNQTSNVDFYRCRSSRFASRLGAPTQTRGEVTLLCRSGGFDSRFQPGQFCLVDRARPRLQASSAHGFAERPPCGSGFITTTPACHWRSRTQGSRLSPRPPSFLAPWCEGSGARRRRHSAHAAARLGSGVPTQTTLAWRGGSRARRTLPPT